MTTPHKALLQQALDALEDAYMHTTDRTDYRTFKAAAEALQATIDEPDAEPVAWATRRDDGGLQLFFMRASAEREAFCQMGRTPVIELFSDPPAPRQPLTTEQWRDIVIKAGVDPERDDAVLVEKVVRAVEAAHGVKP